MWAYATFIDGFASSPLGMFGDLLPWQLTSQSERIVSDLLLKLGNDYAVSDSIAIHRTAQLEAGAVLKGPLVIGPGCFVAAGAYLRGGCWLEADNIIGPSCELKSSFLFRATKLAHFNFVGDSLIGAHCNFEAGSIVANYRNERDGADIRIVSPFGAYETGVAKFGLLAGDGVKVGANAVIAPGAILGRGHGVARLALIDQWPAA
jgi:NDP-sugar pyrophosphorylase family protein